MSTEDTLTLADRARAEWKSMTEKSSKPQQELLTDYERRKMVAMWSKKERTIVLDAILKTQKLYESHNDVINAWTKLLTLDDEELGQLHH